MKQLRFGTPTQKEYSYGQYNKIKGDAQAIRISEGCPHNCPFCREPTEFKFWGVPLLERNKVLIYDMNLLAKPEAVDVLKHLMRSTINDKVIYYELTCGIDYRFLTPDIAEILYNGRFGNFNKGRWTRNIKIAWDWGYDQFRGIFDALQMLLKAGFKPGQISIFMVCNWKIPFNENMKKLQACGIWNVLVNDCYFDNQTFPDVKPEHWTFEELRYFRTWCQKHNQLIRFDGYDPAIDKTLSTIRRIPCPL